MSYNDKSTTIKDQISFVPAQKYFEILQGLIMDMLECSKTRDIYGMVDTYQEIYLLSFPFIEKFLDKYPLYDKIVSNTEDVDGCLNMVGDDASDFASKNNNKYIQQAKTILNKKKKILYKMMAKANLFVPMSKIREDRPAALAMDDF